MTSNENETHPAWQTEMRAAQARRNAERERQAAIEAEAVAALDRENGKNLTAALRYLGIYTGSTLESNKYEIDGVSFSLMLNEFGQAIYGKPYEGHKGAYPSFTLRVSATAGDDDDPWSTSADVNIHRYTGHSSVKAENREEALAAVATAIDELKAIIAWQATTKATATATPKPEDVLLKTLTALIGKIVNDAHDARGEA